MTLESVEEFSFSFLYSISFLTYQYNTGIKMIDLGNKCSFLTRFSLHFELSLDQPSPTKVSERTW